MSDKEKRIYRDVVRELGVFVGTAYRKSLNCRDSLYENGYSESQTDYYRREVGTLPKSISLKNLEQLENEANDLFDEINRGLDKVVIDEAVEDVELLDEIEELLGIKKDAPTQEPKSEPVDSTEKKVFTTSFRIRNYVRK